MAYLNVRSMLFVGDEVKNLFITENINILAMTETWLDDSIGDSEICPSGYDIFRRDRNRKGGGVAILIFCNLYLGLI